MIRPSRLARLGLGVAAAALLSGCATSKNQRDPIEGFNRAMFGFNETVDQVALKPAATLYQEALPGFVQTGIGNFFGNIGDVWTSANNLLQGKLEEGMSDVGRVTINTLVGLGGVIDVASDAGLPKHREDFGQTLGKWGVKAGPYVVLPLLGSSTVRDTAALPVDIMADPWFYVDPTSVRSIGAGVRIIDQRAAVLNASTLIDEAALDKYEFVRDAYLQRRRSQIGDIGRRKGGKKASPESDDWVTVDDEETEEDAPEPDKLSGNNLINKHAASSEAAKIAAPVQPLPRRPDVPSDARHN